MKSGFRTIFLFSLAIIMMASQLLMADDAALDKNLKNPLAVEQLGVAKLSIAKKPLIPKKKPIILNVPPGPKGQIGPAVATYAQMTLDKEILKVDFAEEGAEGDLGEGRKGDLPPPKDAKVDVDKRGVRGDFPGGKVAASMPYPMREGFEFSDWRENWEFWSSHGLEWERTDCTSYEGSYSAWPFAFPPGALEPCIDDYPNDNESRMVYGPFDLSGVTSGWLEFALNLQSELGYDYIKYMVSIDGSSFYGYGISGNTGGWVDINPI